MQYTVIKQIYNILYATTTSGPLELTALTPRFLVLGINNIEKISYTSMLNLVVIS